MEEKEVFLSKKKRGQIPGTVKRKSPNLELQIAQLPVNYGT
jgi:hypothetical protein